MDRNVAMIVVGHENAGGGRTAEPRSSWRGPSPPRGVVQQSLRPSSGSIPISRRLSNLSLCAVTSETQIYNRRIPKFRWLQFLVVPYIIAEIPGSEDPSPPKITIICDVFGKCEFFFFCNTCFKYQSL